MGNESRSRDALGEGKEAEGRRFPEKGLAELTLRMSRHGQQAGKLGSWQRWWGAS